MFTKKLSKVEVECGLIRFGAENREMFPTNGSTITMIDSKGEEYETHVHRTVNRVDCLTAMNKNNNAREGTTVIVQKVDGRNNTYRVIYQ